MEGEVLQRDGDPDFSDALASLERAVDQGKFTAGGLTSQPKHFGDTFTTAAAVVTTPPTCHPGYERSVEGICVDVNECLRNPCLMEQICLDRPGSYECVCREGYELTEEWNATDSGSHFTNCSNVDECLRHSPSVCGVNASCIDTIGGYVCESAAFACVKASEKAVICRCADGFENVGDVNDSHPRCRDIDECSQDGEADPCRDHQLRGSVCVNREGGYDCECPPGFAKERQRINGTQSDICVRGNEMITKQ